MKTFNYTITDAVGIHARPSGILAKEAKKYESKIVIKKGDRQAEATKVMTLMALGAKCGEEVSVEVTGADEEQACAEVEAFFKENL